jgi:hypothetical protein
MRRHGLTYNGGPGATSRRFYQTGFERWSGDNSEVLQVPPTAGDEPQAEGGWWEQGNASDVWVKQSITARAYFFKG